MIEKIEKYSLVEEAYKRIKNDILTLAEGTKIPSENSYCRALNVSRVVVREALARLKSEKIIVSYQGKGSYRAEPTNFITDALSSERPDIEMVKEVLDFRSAIEYASIKLAVEVASDNELLILADNAQALSDNKCDQEAFNLADYRFHLSIVECAHNKFLLSAMENCKDAVLSVLRLMNAVDGQKNYPINLHRQIAEKIIARDAKGAIDLLKNNGEFNLARLEELFKKV